MDDVERICPCGWRSGVGRGEGRGRGREAREGEKGAAGKNKGSIFYYEFCKTQTRRIMGNGFDSRGFDLVEVNSMLVEIF